MPVLKHLFDAKRDYRRCLNSEIWRHFVKIKHWVPENEKEEFQKRMLECIEEGTAWCTDNTFLYYHKENPRISHGVAIFGMDHPMEMLALFFGVFTYEDKNTFTMRFKLHPGKFLEEYKSLLTTTSIMRTHANPKHPLMIRIDAFRDKVYKLVTDSGIAK